MGGSGGSGRERASNGTEENKHGGESGGSCGVRACARDDEHGCGERASNGTGEGRHGGGLLNSMNRGEILILHKHNVVNCLCICYPSCLVCSITVYNSTVG